MVTLSLRIRAHTHTHTPALSHHHDLRHGVFKCTKMHLDALSPSASDLTLAFYAHAAAELDPFALSAAHWLKFFPYSYSVSGSDVGGLEQPVRLERKQAQARASPALLLVSHGIWLPVVKRRGLRGGTASIRAMQVRA